MAFLVSGASGFIGSRLLDFLPEDCHVIGRTKPSHKSIFFELDFLDEPDYSDALTNVKVVIHCAARAHVMNEYALDPLDEYRKVNTLATITLAKQAASNGVSRFIFISSIKVNGESTSDERVYTSNDIRRPEDFYGISKSEAEIQLLQLGLDTGMEIVIIRPTMVYGPGVKANFATLLGLVSKGLPLPFGSITKNKRSLVSVDNLVDLIVTCINHPNAANQVFIASDDHDLSTSEIVMHIAQAMGKPLRLFPMPLFCYKLAGKLFNKSAVVDRLIGSLQVDITHTKETLDWKPPQRLEEAFKKTAQFFLQSEINK